MLTYPNDMKLPSMKTIIAYSALLLVPGGTVFILGHRAYNYFKARKVKKDEPGV